MSVFSEAPGPSPLVSLTAPEADATRAYFMGDHFDIKLIESTWKKIDAALGEGRWGIDDED